MDRYVVSQVMPCKADHNKIRVIIDLQQDIGDLLPYLNAIIKLGTYVGSENRSLTFQYEGRLITLYPRKVTLSKLSDLEDANYVMTYLLGLFEQTDTNRSQIIPIDEQRPHPNPMEIYKRLPRTNCRLCGEAACMAFAVKLIHQELELEACTPLGEEKYQQNKQELQRFLDGKD